MDHEQLYTFLGTTISMLATMGGGLYIFYQLIQKEIAVMREDMSRSDSQHREDMQLIDSRWERLFERMDRKIELVEQKWEHVINLHKEKR